MPTACLLHDDTILKWATSRGGVYSREAFIYLKFNKDEAFIRRGVNSREAFNQRNTVDV